ncbi:unnamed protein product [Ceratitis capitata]|uniref:(Mediterranean fruit fly) hypothetical protein n=1 Tax=Ceratitis capitata TaxID=7213 RepID=A0A811VGY6_CERCA|nr:unnamed protein product [Ceratitis capitata]
MDRKCVANSLQEKAAPNKNTENVIWNRFLLDSQPGIRELRDDISSCRREELLQSGEDQPHAM